ncbi:MAG TPA: IS66 family transposase [Rhodanobacter sp.]|nr:IS66 family transposase [Rhodanobacter sp.]
MQNATSSRTANTTDIASLSLPQMIALVQSMDATIQTLKHQLDWFKRQLFGQKSERQAPLPDPTQMHLGEMMPLPATPAAELPRTIPAHTRRGAKRDLATDSEAVPFFDESRVPVQIIHVPDAATAGLAEDQFEVIGEKVSYRLAQRPGSFVVLKYLRPVTKRRDTQVISCPPAPVGVIAGSRADVSFAAGLLVDKCAYHLPLYRQHQRLADGGITVSRPWLTQLSQQIIALLEPIYDAQFDVIRCGRVIAMDETPIKAGRRGDGKMKVGYFWPVYGEHDEVCFPFFPSRAHANVISLLGLSPAEGSVLLSDGYAAYASYAKKTGLTHAQCWAHTRRGFFEAQTAEPEGAGAALEQIGALYAVEEQIREGKLTGEAKRLHRLTHSKPQVERFFDWIERQFQRQGLLPSNPFTQALAYARERRLGLEVFLADPDVPIDTNPLERALRAIPMGRKNWNFCWTELGARHVGIVQSLIVTCRLHGIDPYTYLVDVLQRVGQHPASRVAELTPRQWKQHFAQNPLRSDLCLAHA